MLSTLPRADRLLLCCVQGFVPGAQREDWLRTWQAELWHLHHNHRSRGTGRLPSVADLMIGLALDALWLRLEGWRCILSGTAGLCLASLVGLCSLCFALALALNGRHLHPYLSGQLQRCALAAPLITFVCFATATSRHTQPAATGKANRWLTRKVFFSVKTLLVFVLAFLLSSNLCRSLHASFPNTADFLQMLLFVPLAIVGLRWSLQDQDQRCMHCLRALAAPARVGRPSHNLLEWNGTELLCKQGHGLLSIPEIETSWRQSSEWISHVASVAV